MAWNHSISQPLSMFADNIKLYKHLQFCCCICLTLRTLAHKYWSYLFSISKKYNNIKLNSAGTRVLVKSMVGSVNALSSLQQVRWCYMGIYSINLPIADLNTSTVWITKIGLHRKTDFIHASCYHTNKRTHDNTVLKTQRECCNYRE